MPSPNFCAKAIELVVRPTMRRPERSSASSAVSATIDHRIGAVMPLKIWMHAPRPKTCSMFFGSMK